jgi:hypothetical protein
MEKAPRFRWQRVEENELDGSVNREDIQEAFTSAPPPNRFLPIAAAEILGLSRK